MFGSPAPAAAEAQAEGESEAFVGRELELKRLEELLGQAAGGLAAWSS